MPRIVLLAVMGAAAVSGWFHFGHHRPGHLGQPEVEQLRAAAGKHDVAGLQVAVDHTLAVRGIKGSGNLDGDAERFFEGQGAPAELRF